jgi:flagellar hook-basal body complex protein FliE
MISSVSALSSVGSTAAAGGVAPPATTAATPATDFTTALAEVASEAMGNLKSGEAAAIQGIGGNMGLQEVVSAIMSAEQTLHTAIAVRDKVVAAYQEVTRMAI